MNKLLHKLDFTERRAGESSRVRTESAGSQTCHFMYVQRMHQKHDAIPGLVTNMRGAIRASGLAAAALANAEKEYALYESMLDFAGAAAGATSAETVSLDGGRAGSKKAPQTKREVKFVAGWLDF